jgi:hypothetical protein
MGPIVQRVVVTILKEKCLQPNTQTINVLLRTMCAKLIDHIIFGDGEPLEDAHLIWTKLCQKVWNIQMQWSSSQQGHHHYHR